MDPHYVFRGTFDEFLMPLEEKRLAEKMYGKLLQGWYVQAERFHNILLEGNSIFTMLFMPDPFSF